MTEDGVAEKIAGQIRQTGYARVPSSIIRDIFRKKDEQAMMSAVERFATEHGWRVALSSSPGGFGVMVFYPEVITPPEGHERMGPEEGQPEAPDEAIEKRRKAIDDLPDAYIAAVAKIAEATRSLDEARDKCVALQQELLQAVAAKSQAERALQEALENMKRAARHGDKDFADDVGFGEDHFRGPESHQGD